MRPYILSESNWKSIKEATYEVAVLPWGATEAHNYHLPYGTDSIEADFVASESAKDTGVGDLRKASSEKGKQYLEAVTRKVGLFFLDLAKSDKNNLYV